MLSIDQLLPPLLCAPAGSTPPPLGPRRIPEQRVVLVLCRTVVTVVSVVVADLFSNKNPNYKNKSQRMNIY